MTSSLRKNFPPSASGWSSPPGPTRFGPRRSCIHAEILRSERVRNPHRPRTPPIRQTMTIAVVVGSNEGIDNPIKPTRGNGWACAVSHRLQLEPDAVGGQLLLGEPREERHRPRQFRADRTGLHQSATT